MSIKFSKFIEMRNKVFEQTKIFVTKNKKSFQIMAIFIILLSTMGNTYVGQYPELNKLLNLLDFFIGLIKWGSASVAALIATITGWHIMTNTKGNAMADAKTTLKQSLTGLVIVFFGSALADFLIGKFTHILG